MTTKQPKFAYISVTDNGLELCARIRGDFPGDILTLEKRSYAGVAKSFQSFAEMMAYAFAGYDCLVCVMATGIVVRSIARLIRSKTKDPAVLVLDEKGEFCISLLSGHIGGANAYTRMIADKIGAHPVITTASDVSGKIAVDTLAMSLGCAISDMTAAKDITALIVGSGKVVVNYEGAIYISAKPAPALPIPYVQLIPRNLVLGMGCRKGMPAAKVLAFVEQEMTQLGLRREAIKFLGTVDVKAEEKGLIEAAAELRAEFSIVERSRIAEVEQRFASSSFVRKTIGVGAVAEPVGYIVSGGGECLLPVVRKDGMTLSIWRINK